jgi:hypothetical protein
MDVRISFGVDLDSVPDRIVDMLASMDVNGAAKMIDLVVEVLRTSNPDMADRLIDQARAKLADLDRVLSDSQMILKGYLSAIETQETAKTSPEESPQVD